jgi:hypothetical protein
MKLDRNHGGTQNGKYAVIRMREMRNMPETLAIVDRLAMGGFVQFDNPGDSDEFFILKTKDRYAAAALTAYAQAALADDPEYAAEILAMAARAAAHPQRKKPD